MIDAANEIHPSQTPGRGGYRNELIFLGILIGVGVGAVVLDRLIVDRDHHWVQTGDELKNCWVVDQFDRRADRGVILVCDSFVLSNDQRLIPSSVDLARSNPSDWNQGLSRYSHLLDLRTPYLVSKESGSDTLVIQKEQRIYRFIPSTGRAADGDR